MIRVPVVIVGGGPAGASCAWRLVEAGLDCLVVDKQAFPRQKLCAGWLTPAVFEYLGLGPDSYPHDLTRFRGLRIHLKGIPFWYPGQQYAVRRVEFDSWLLERSGANFLQHEVKQITRSAAGYLLDGIIRADFVVGAGGTHCPVFHTFWGQDQPRTGSRIVALESEFRVSGADPTCRLWFFERGFPGYAWYVPKAGGYLNIGLGGPSGVLKRREQTIHQGWEQLLEKLSSRGLLKEQPPQPQGYVYYLRGDDPELVRHQACLVGDAAGLASLDMGEGIGPAIRSGQLAAEAILGGEPYSTADIPRYSLLPSGLRWLLR